METSRQQRSNKSGSIQQEASESVKVVAVVTDITSTGQADRHLVPSVKAHGHHSRAAVFIVPAVFLSEGGHRLAVDLQVATGSQVLIRRNKAVDCDCEAVDTRAWSGEDARLQVVVVSQVQEDMSVEDQFVVAEGAEAAQT